MWGATPWIVRTAETWAVVYKPRGMSMYQESDHDLVTWLRDRSGLGGDATPCHRLDRDAGGLVMVSLQKRARGPLQTLWAECMVRKTYQVHLDLRDVRGLFSPGRVGRWDWSLASRSFSRDDLRGEGRLRAPAITEWTCCDVRADSRSMCEAPTVGLFECRPLSGRKHQIRRHAALAGCPVVGDTVYGRRDDDNSDLGEWLALWATQIEFVDPFSRQGVRVWLDPCVERR